MKVTINAKADHGSKNVHVVVEIEGKSADFDVANLNVSDFMSGFSQGRTSRYGATSQRFLFTTSREYSGIKPRLNKLKEMIISENQKLFDKYPEIDVTIEVTV